MVRSGMIDSNTRTEDRICTVFGGPPCTRRPWAFWPTRWDRLCPRRWFDPHRAPYRCRDWEQGGRVYNKLYIRRWKDRLPDMSRLMPDMVKKAGGGGPHVPGAGDLRGRVRPLLAGGAVRGYAFLWKSVWSWALWLVYNLLGNVSFILIQRYNRPRLLRLAEKENKKRL